VWEVTTYVGIDAQKKEPTEQRASCGSSRARRLVKTLRSDGSYSVSRQLRYCFS